MDGCPDAPVLQYQYTGPGHKGVPEHVFSLVAGSLDTRVADNNERSFYDHILVEDVEDTESIPVEALFDDLGVSGLVFPLNKFTKPRWSQQHPRVREGLLLVDVRDITTDDAFGIKVSLKATGESQIRFVVGQNYRVSPRYVDFNTTKILEALVELDFRRDEISDADTEHGGLPFIQLLVDPKSFGRDREQEAVLLDKQAKRRGMKIQSLFKTLKGLDVEASSPLVLKNSQTQASRRILSNRLAVVWGPPGMNNS